ncbi:MAG: 30S ribosomal protein S5 [bacterium]
MTTEDNKKIAGIPVQAPVNPVASQAPTNAPKAPDTRPPFAGGRGGNTGYRGGGGSSGPRRGGPRRGERRDSKERIKPEFDTKVILMRRVTRVTKGGRRMSFSVTVVSGDRKGRVGVGLGKSIDTTLAIDKATRDAKKNMIRVNHTIGMSIPHDVYAKYSSARVMIMPAKGRGLIAGSAVRNVLELAGLKDINAKIMSGSKNKINIARVAVKALAMLPKMTKLEAKLDTKPATPTTSNTPNAPTKIENK